MIKIGKNQLLQTHTLLVHKDDTASVEIKIGKSLAIFIITFNDDSPSPSIETKVNENSISLQLNKWNSQIGTALKSPISFAENSDKNELLFSLANYRIGENNKLDIFIFKRENKN